MVRAMYSGVSGLRSHQSKMDVIGNNIANVNTYSFKASRAAFQDVFYQTLQGSSNPGDNYGGSNAMQVGYGSKISSIDMLFTNSGFAPTDYPLDCMINGNGFFMVGPAGCTDVSQMKMTRVGMFGIDAAGNLVDAGGNFVYGYSSVRDGNDMPDLDNPTYNTTNLVPLKVPQDATGNPIELSGISIGADGTLSGINSGGNVVCVGKISVANVPNPQGLTQDGSSYFTIRENTGVVTHNIAGEGTTGKIQSGGLEMSNVDLSKEFTDMITTQRGFQANSRIITVSDEMLQELVNLKR